MKHITCNKQNKNLLHDSCFMIQDQSGVTLIEVIVSMFMVMVLFVLYVAALNTVALVKKLNMENIAYHVANKQMEDLRNMPVASLPASGTISDTMLSQIPSGAGSFVVTNDYGNMGGVKEIAVTVSWNDGTAKQIVLKTLAGTGGINP